jgi:DNA-binding response OmpR family regulator
MELMIGSRNLTLGADDYLTKPFAIAEVDARLEAVVRWRRHGQADSRVLVGDLEMDLAAKKVLRAGKHIVLTAGILPSCLPGS